MKIKNPDLKQLLLNYGDRRDHHGDHPHELLTAEDATKFEDGLNYEIDNAKDEEMDKLIKLRYMFRILQKYGNDINVGESLLMEFYNEYYG